MGSLPKKFLHKQILIACDNEIQDHGPVDTVPFDLQLAGIGAVRIYAFTLTSPPGGRPTDEYKIQMIVPGQSRGSRGALDMSGEGFTLLLGWSQEEEVFALWDAYAYSSFAFSRNLQVKGATLWVAKAVGVATGERHLRGGAGVETVVAARPDWLTRAIIVRIEQSSNRLQMRDLTRDRH
jgi:hypothetical protein